MSDVEIKTDRLYTILVIDDDNSILSLMEDILTPEFTVAAFDRGAPALSFAALQKQAQVPVVAAFIDLTLEEQSGLDVASQLIEIDEHINIILMTGDPNFSSSEMDPKLMSHLLLVRKPFSIQEVILLAHFCRRIWIRDLDLRD